MKISEAISRIDSLKHNTYTEGDKIQWLSRLDTMVKKHIIDTHEGADVAFTVYNDDTDPQVELLVPAPHDEVYLLWMEAQIHYYNGEYDKYNNAIVMFDASFEDFKNYYNRTHMPKGTKFNYF